MTRASLLISTYNWPAALAAVLATVRSQRVMPTEVLIADDGSGPETAALIAREQATFPVPLRHFWQEDDGFRKARILNEALAHASGEYIVQADGDMLLHPRFVESHLRCARPGFYIQGSRVMLEVKWTERCLADRAIPAHPVFSFGLRNRANSIHAPWLTPLYRGPKGALKGTRGCNTSYWKADLMRVNGWNEEIVGWGREDPELVARLQNAGVRRRNVKFQAVAFHLDHASVSRSAVPRFHQLVLDTVANGRSTCEHGVAQHRLVG